MQAKSQTPLASSHLWDGPEKGRADGFGRGGARLLTYDEQTEVLCYEDGRVRVDLGPVGRAVLAPVQLQQLLHDGWVDRHLWLTKCKRKR